MENSAPNFKSQLERVSEWALQKKIAHAYNGGTGHFENLPTEQQTLAITGLQKYFEFLQDFTTEEFDFANSHVLLKKALERLNLYLDPELLNMVKPTDFVEIYASDYVPAFKSVNFWGNSSYTLDELYTQPYEELFGRDEFYQAAIRRSAEKVFKGKERVIFNPVPEHVAWEKKGPYKRLIKYKYFAAVYDPNMELAGTIVVCDITPLEN